MTNIFSVRIDKVQRTLAVESMRTKSCLIHSGWQVANEYQMHLHDHFKLCPTCGGRDLKMPCEKSLVCSDCDFTYYHNTGAAVAGIIVQDSKVLLTVRAREPFKGMFDLPGGFIDYREDAEVALKREIREELNIEISQMQFLLTAPNLYHYKNVTYHILDLIYICKPASLSNICPQDDVEDYQFVDPRQFDLKKMAFVSTRIGMERYLADLRG
ncbi:MAG: NUDIX domain-containing protein [Phycisphaerae bacterium]|nr:NUDIX domain-containing protein [Phycisphaerae bacterium]